MKEKLIANECLLCVDPVLSALTMQKSKCLHARFAGEEGELRAEPQHKEAITVILKENTHPPITKQISSTIV